MVSTVVQVSPWNNHWWNIHDFSPVDGGTNWSRLGRMFKVLLAGVEMEELLIVMLVVLVMMPLRSATSSPCLPTPQCAGWT